MSNLKHTGGKWVIRKTVDTSGDYPFPTYDILAVFEYGPQGIGSAYQHPYNALLFASASEMLKVLINLYKISHTACYTYCQGSHCDDCGMGAYRAKEIKEIIEKATGQSIDEVLKSY